MQVRRVFFSFQYEDVDRACVVRNSDKTGGKHHHLGFIDSADFEQVKKQGDEAIRRWIQEQLSDTSVTVVLVGSTTHQSRWVRYEIDKSMEQGNGLITIDISNIPNAEGHTSAPGTLRVPGCQHYTWEVDESDEQLPIWIENAAQAAGK